ncbi:MAG: hypothetical protein HC897_07390 [Thermoanaerobaculia bacterium]|nr:hypothetical protein [Thermoanaerobaculia bacterium]
MPDTYTIYLINEGASTQNFWCFLQRPQELVDDPNVFANSSTQLAVPPNSPAINTFTIPVQYVVGAGASNHAVGLGIQVTSTTTVNAELNDEFSATYADVPPPLGPTLTQSGTGAGPNQISIASNAFNQVNNEANGWFSNMSFGIQTAQGFMGMTWSPSPSQTTTLTPTLQFYVAVGSYGSNTLASWNTVSNTSAQLTVPYSFALRKATVTYTATGQWQVTPGAPPAAQLARASQLSGVVDAHRSLSQAHSDLISLLGSSVAPASGLFGDATSQLDTVQSVTWDSALPEAGGAALAIPLLGVLTVKTALVSAFSYFTLSGITFNITSAPVNGTTIQFSYSGNQSAAAIEALLKAGAQILLGR